MSMGGYLFWILFGFKGRLGLRPYLLASLGVLCTTILYFFLGFLLWPPARFMSTNGVITMGGPPLLFLLPVLLLALWAGLALSVKRLHDAGQTGWWALIPLSLSAVGNIAGHGTGLGLKVAAFVGGLIILFLPSSAGENQYGAPLKPGGTLMDASDAQNFAKLEMLEEQYHNGEITEEVYEKRRRELLGLG